MVPESLREQRKESVGGTKMAEIRDIGVDVAAPTGGAVQAANDSDAAEAGASELGVVPQNQSAEGAAAIELP